MTRRVIGLTLASLLCLLLLCDQTVISSPPPRQLELSGPSYLEAGETAEIVVTIPRQLPADGIVSFEILSASNGATVKIYNPSAGQGNQSGRTRVWRIKALTAGEVSYRASYTYEHSPTTTVYSDPIGTSVVKLQVEFGNIIAGAIAEGSVFWSPPEVEPAFVDWNALEVESQEVFAQGRLVASDFEFNATYLVARLSFFVPAEHAGKIISLTLEGETQDGSSVSYSQFFEVISEAPKLTVYFDNTSPSIAAEGQTTVMMIHGQTPSLAATSANFYAADEEGNPVGISGDILLTAVGTYGYEGFFEFFCPEGSAGRVFNLYVQATVDGQWAVASLEVQVLPEEEIMAEIRFEETFIEVQEGQPYDVAFVITPLGIEGGIRGISWSVEVPGVGVVVAGQVELARLALHNDGIRGDFVLDVPPGTFSEVTTGTVRLELNVYGQTSQASVPLTIYPAYAPEATIYIWQEAPILMRENRESLIRFMISPESIWDQIEVIKWAFFERGSDVGLATGNVDPHSLSPYLQDLLGWFSFTPPEGFAAISGGTGEGEFQMTFWFDGQTVDSQRVAAIVREAVNVSLLGDGTMVADTPEVIEVVISPRVDVELLKFSVADLTGKELYEWVMYSEAFVPDLDSEGNEILRGETTVSVPGILVPKDMEVTIQARVVCVSGEICAEASAKWLLLKEAPVPSPRIDSVDPAAAMPLSLPTLYGANLGDMETCMVLFTFGGMTRELVPASISSDGTELTFQVPYYPAGGPAMIAVRVGQETSDPISFEVLGAEEGIDLAGQEIQEILEQIVARSGQAIATNVKREVERALQFAEKGKEGSSIRALTHAIVRLLYIRTAYGVDVSQAVELLVQARAVLAWTDLLAWATLEMVREYERLHEMGGMEQAMAPLLSAIRHTGVALATYIEKPGLGFIKHLRKIIEFLEEARRPRSPGVQVEHIERKIVEWCFNQMQRFYDKLETRLDPGNPDLVRIAAILGQARESMGAGYYLGTMVIFEDDLIEVLAALKEELSCDLAQDDVYPCEYIQGQLLCPALGTKTIPFPEPIPCAMTRVSEDKDMRRWKCANVIPPCLHLFPYDGYISGEPSYDWRILGAEGLPRDLLGSFRADERSPTANTSSVVYYPPCVPRGQTRTVSLLGTIQDSRHDARDDWHYLLRIDLTHNDDGSYAVEIAGNDYPASGSDEPLPLGFCLDKVEPTSDMPPVTIRELLIPRVVKVDEAATFMARAQDQDKFTAKCTGICMLGLCCLGSEGGGREEDGVTYQWSLSGGSGGDRFLEGISDTASVLFNPGTPGEVSVTVECKDSGLILKDKGDFGTMRVTRQVTKVVLDLDADSDNNGQIEGSPKEEAIENMYSGMYIALNDDDDNGNETLDLEETGFEQQGLENEDDLAEVSLNFEAPSHDGTLTLREIQRGDKIRIWRNRDKKGGQITPGEPLNLSDMPLTLWIEGVVLSSSRSDFATLGLEWRSGEDMIVDAIRITIVKVELRSIEFTSDHQDENGNNILKKSAPNDRYADVGQVYVQPEWEAASERNNPITHTGNTRISIKATVRVQPAELLFNLVGDGADNYVDFRSESFTSTGANQEIPMTAREKLPAEICYLKRPIEWKALLEVGEFLCEPTTSGGADGHEIFVTLGNPLENSTRYTNSLTYKRVKLMCSPYGSAGIAGGDTDQYSAAEHTQLWIRDEAGFWGDPTAWNGNDIWGLLDGTGKGQCHQGGNLMDMGMRLLGVESTYEHIKASSSLPVRFATTSSIELEIRYNCSQGHGLERLMMWLFNDWNSGEGSCRVGDRVYPAFYDFFGDDQGSRTAEHHVLIQLGQIEGEDFQRWQREDNSEYCGEWAPVPDVP